MGRKALVTDAIYNQLDRLKKKQNGGKKRLHAKEALAELRLLVRTGVLPPNTKLPGESAIRKALQELNKPLNSPLDNPWSIGACLKYDIPGDMIPCLVKVKQIFEGTNIKFPPSFSLTIRLARWFSRLFPSIEKLIQAKKPDCSEMKNLGYHFLIAEQYAGLERLSAQLGRDCPDTSDLDIIIQDLDINLGFLSVFIPDLTGDYRQFKERQRDGEK